MVAVKKDTTKLIREIGESMSDSKISNSEAIICLWTNSLNRCCLRL